MTELKKVGTYAKLVLIFYILLIVFNLLVYVIFQHFQVEMPTSTIVRNGFVEDIVRNVPLGVFITFFSALVEECGFRLIPYCLTVGYFKNSKFLPFTAILSTALFGFIHGGGLFIYLSAMIGLILFWGFYLMVKVENDPANATVAVAFSHFLYNLTVTVIKYWL